MRRHRILHMPLRNTRSTDKQGNADVFLETAGLAWRKSMLTNVEPIVGGVDNVCVVQLVTLFEAGHECVHKLVDTLQSTQARAVEKIMIVDHGLVLLREVPDPTDSAGLKAVREITDLTQLFNLYVPHQD